MRAFAVLENGGRSPFLVVANATRRLEGAATVTVPEGALSPRRKEGLIEEATEILLEEIGIEGREFTDKVRVWVHSHEVPEGHWGSAGQVFRYKDIVTAVTGKSPAPVAT